MQNLILEIRKQMNVSQDDLAKMIGISFAAFIVTEKRVQKNRIMNMITDFFINTSCLFLCEVFGVCDIIYQHIDA